MALGVITGAAMHQWLTPSQIGAATDDLSLLTDLFLRLIRMIIAPLVFSTLVVGIAHMEDPRRHRPGRRQALGWFLIASIVSLTLGLAMVHLLKPGMGASPCLRECMPPTR